MYLESTVSIETQSVCLSETESKTSLASLTGMLLKSCILESINKPHLEELPPVSTAASTELQIDPWHAYVYGSHSD
ncbi:hypothetical protein ONS95_010477 [Cadophora gregata]|uniref:uncharacterized protein n=1 Tax=Cadophora gregata TaxID=51156 RepID=UPI0026DD8234|nr:uncharacterized protein ONS95_010477 [Cadophora gregata]KAK0122223.1 hypothetical protein ONS95_010477 [Cadophora gregata]KAK0127700.1 hypothetical protein ONS96_007218 [Cadophora gregata f. sp. sojae]